MAKLDSFLDKGWRFLGAGLQRTVDIGLGASKVAGSAIGTAGGLTAQAASYAIHNPVTDRAAALRWGVLAGVAEGFKELGNLEAGTVGARVIEAGKEKYDSQLAIEQQEGQQLHDFTEGFTRSAVNQAAEGADLVLRPRTRRHGDSAGEPWQIVDPVEQTGAGQAGQYFGDVYVPYLGSQVIKKGARKVLPEGSKWASRVIPGASVVTAASESVTDDPTAFLDESRPDRYVAGPHGVGPTDKPTVTSTSKDVNPDIPAVPISADEFDLFMTDDLFKSKLISQLGNASNYVRGDKAKQDAWSDLDAPGIGRALSLMISDPQRAQDLNPDIDVDHIRVAVFTAAQEMEAQS